MSFFLLTLLHLLIKIYSTMSDYLYTLLKAYPSIQGIWITDFEGALILNAYNTSAFDPKASEAENDISKDKSEESTKFNEKVKISLSFLLNSALDQITKIEKLNTKSIVSIFENFTIFQSKLNKNSYIHYICLTNTFNYEMMKIVSKEISEKFASIESELEKVTSSEI